MPDLPPEGLLTWPDIEDLHRGRHYWEPQRVAAAAAAKMDAYWRAKGEAGTPPYAALAPSTPGTPSIRDVANQIIRLLADARDSAEAVMEMVADVFCPGCWMIEPLGGCHYWNDE